MVIPLTHNQKRAGSATGHLLGRNEAGDKALSDALVQPARAFPGVQSRLNSENCTLLYTLLCNIPVTLDRSFTVSLLSSLHHLQSGTRALSPA